MRYCVASRVISNIKLTMVPNQLEIEVMFISLSMFISLDKIRLLGYLILSVSLG